MIEAKKWDQVHPLALLKPAVFSTSIFFDARIAAGTGSSHKRPLLITLKP